MPSSSSIAVFPMVLSNSAEYRALPRTCQPRNDAAACLLGAYVSRGFVVDDPGVGPSPDVCNGSSLSTSVEKGVGLRDSGDPSSSLQLQERVKSVSSHSRCLSSGPQEKRSSHCYSYKSMRACPPSFQPHILIWCPQQPNGEGPLMFPPFDG